MVVHAQVVAVVLSGISACQGTGSVAKQPQTSRAPASAVPPSSGALVGQAPSGDIAQGGVRCPPNASAAAQKSLPFEWQKTLFSDRAAGSVLSMEADEAGVVVCGKEDARHAKPFVARFTREGRQAWRTAVESPKAGAVLTGAALAVVGAPLKGALVLAASWEANAGLSLTKLDERGVRSWVAPVEGSPQPPPLLAADADGGALLASTLNPQSRGAGSLEIVKYSPNGSVAWRKSYPHDVRLERVVRTARGFMLAGSAYGPGRGVVGGGTVAYRCGGQTATCHTPSAALWLMEIDANGTPIRSRTIGAPENVLEVSDLAALPSGFLVTGEFRGPPLKIGNDTVCEMEPGMPGVQPKRFETAGTPDPCDCAGRRSDLFVLALDADAEPVWSRALGVGSPDPRLVVDGNGRGSWSATLGDPADPTRPATFSLWTMDETGAVRARHTLGAGPLVAAAADGSIYVSDTRMLGRAIPQKQ